MNKYEFLVVVVVYNRVDNIREWVHTWSQCQREGSLLVVIHNHSTTEDYDQVKKLVGIVGGLYIPRQNVGFDVGALQDVCRGRLVEFPTEFEFVLWVTDDTLPMRPTLLQEFRQAMQGNVLACMELSQEIRRHVRTTGFCMRKEHLLLLEFPIDPITTKQHCYDFEHRGGKITLLEQAEKLGTVTQVGDIENSPLWDTGHRSRAAIRRSRRRREEYIKQWSAHPMPVLKPTITENPQVVFICPVYNNYPQIISSLQAQTYKNWKLHLIHDGPADKFLEMYNPILQVGLQDERIQFHVTAQRSGNWGHIIRRNWINMGLGDFVVVTNADNYHVPTYIEFMLAGFEPGIVATYCSQMVHNYKAHQTIDCRLARGYVDCAGVMVRSDIAREVGWRHLDDHSADWLYFQDIFTRYGTQSFKEIKGCLLIHN